MDFLEKIFKLKENNTNIKTELIAGLTTFFTMSYMLIISPKLLEITGLDLGASITVTSLIIFICSILMGLIANKPYAVAPFLGETAFIAYTIVSLMGYSVKTALTSIFISGIILLLMTLTNIRTYIIKRIPENIKISFCAGLGLFFIFISLKDIGIVSFTSNNIPLQAGNFLSLQVLLGIFCFALIIILTKLKFNAAVLISILITTLIGIATGDVDLPENIFALPSNINSSLLQFDFSNLISRKFLTVFFLIFILVNIDTSGAIIGLGLKSHKSTNNKKPMIADSLAVIISSVMGTTTSGAFFDSMTGMIAGGKTGLTAITTGILFIIGLFLAPLIMIIPSYAYAPALLYVGILIASTITKINFNDITEYAPALLTICIMIFTYNIGLGILSAFIIYPLIKLFTGNKRQTNIVLWTMFAISVIFFIIYPY